MKKLTLKEKIIFVLKENKNMKMTTRKLAEKLLENFSNEFKEKRKKSKKKFKDDKDFIKQIIIEINGLKNKILEEKNISSIKINKINYYNYKEVTEENIQKENKFIEQKNKEQEPDITNIGIEKKDKNNLEIIEENKNINEEIKNEENKKIKEFEKEIEENKEDFNEAIKTIIPEKENNENLKSIIFGISLGLFFGIVIILVLSYFKVFK